MARGWCVRLFILPFLAFAAPEVEASSKPIRWDFPDPFAGALLPPVGDQGLSQTCVPWSVRTVAGFYRRKAAVDAAVAAGLPVSSSLGDGPPSVTFLYNLEQYRTAAQLQVSVAACPLDREVTMSAYLLTAFGAPTEYEAPFTESIDARPTQDQLDDATASRCCWAATLGPIDVAQQVYGHDIPVATMANGDLADGPNSTKSRLVAALARGPAVVMVSVYTDFDCSVRADFRPASPSHRAYRGRHAMVVVGYDAHHHSSLGGPNRAAFRLMNSWGVHWGEAGFVWISARLLFSNEVVPHLADSVTTFDDAATCDWDAPCPPANPSISFPAAFVSQNGWNADPERNSCGATSPPTCMTESVTATSTAACAAPSARAAPIVARAEFPMKRQIRSPRVPLVAALLHSTVRYYVDGVDASTIDPAATGYRLRFARDDASPRVEVDARHEDKLDPKLQHAGGADIQVRVPDPADDIGADPTTIGAWVDRAVFEWVDVNQPTLASKTGVRVCAEVRAPDESEPRWVKSYWIPIPR